MNYLFWFCWLQIGQESLDLTSFPVYALEINKPSPSHVFSTMLCFVTVCNHQTLREICSTLYLESSQLSFSLIYELWFCSIVELILSLDESEIIIDMEHSIDKRHWFYDCKFELLINYIFSVTDLNNLIILYQNT